MAKVLGILNQKGGSGKTTLSTNLAVALQKGGEKVVLVDADPQGSSRDWNEANGGDLLPVVGLDRETLPKDLQVIINSYDWIVIDGAPQIARLAAAAVKSADIVLIPVQPSPYDIWACADLVDIIKARQQITDGLPKSAFIISRAIKNTRLAGDVAQALSDYGLPVFTSLTTQRVVYPTTAAQGRTVFDEKDNEAIKEIEAVRSELREFANG